MAKQYDCIILGAGASGLFCAATLASYGKNVLVADHAARVGKKILVSGGGKCNVTNRTVSFSDYWGERPQFARSALNQFPPEKLITALEKAKIPLEAREHGQLFCRRSAEDIVDWLKGQCQSCSFALGAVFEEIALDAEKFSLRIADRKYSAPALVVATGSPAYPQIGATDLGAQLARRAGHKVFPFSPSLVGLAMPKNWSLAGLAGISVDADVQVIPAGCTSNKSVIQAASALPLLFTHSGISGPAALQASLYYNRGDSLTINFLPGFSLDAYLQTAEPRKKMVKTVLGQLLPARLAERILLSYQNDAERKIAELPGTIRKALAESVHTHRVIPTGTEGMKKAEAAKGGVSVSDIHAKTMESALVPGLYFCGEVLDITGRLGGYNLHWAFASGYAAGNAIGKR